MALKQRHLIYFIIYIYPLKSKPLRYASAFKQPSDDATSNDENGRIFYAGSYFLNSIS